jgi:phage gp45-like
MALIGEIKGRDIGPNRDGDHDVLLLDVELTEPDDVQTVEWMAHTGDDINPPDGSKVVVVSLGDAWQVAISADDLIAPTVEPGERELYSSQGGTRKATVRLHRDGKVDIQADGKARLTLLPDGTIELNGNQDYLVRFSALEKAFNELQKKHNDFMSAYVPGTPILAGVPESGTSYKSLADISSAKVEDLKCTR